MNIAAADDEEAIREQTGGFIKKRNPGFDTSIFATGEGLLAAGKDFDIIFLDIQMEGMMKNERREEDGFQSDR